jgi:hypothetical protein
MSKKRKFLIKNQRKREYNLSEGKWKRISVGRLRRNDRPLRYAINGDTETLTKPTHIKRQEVFI